VWLQMNNWVWFSGKKILTNILNRMMYLKKGDREDLWVSERCKEIYTQVS